MYVTLPYGLGVTYGTGKDYQIGLYQFSSPWVPDKKCFHEKLFPKKLKKCFFECHL